VATALYKFNGLTFDPNGQLGQGTKMIHVDAGITTLLVQDAFNAIRQFEAARPNLRFRGTSGGPPLVRGEGKSPLDDVGLKFTGITMTLLNDWRFWFNTLPAKVTDGNTLAVNIFQNNPIANPVVTIANSTDPALILTGSALTPTQDDRLRELWGLLGLDPNNPADITDTAIDFNGVTVTISLPDANTTRLTRTP
jgi:hypothetical protein